MIAIVDFGMGNLGSIRNMLTRIGADSVVTSDKRHIAAAEKIILPGVGAFDRAMDNLRQLDLVSLLNEQVQTKKTPLLGICLGMQLLSRRSDEGTLPGLGWIDAETVRFPSEVSGQPLMVPHMGWNSISITNPGVLFEGVETEPRFYFVHSYHVRCDHLADVTATAHHGVTFHAAVAHGNVLGTQFHPEKSHKYGLNVLRRFVGWTSC
jgi:glutamine amidotransferase